MGKKSLAPWMKPCHPGREALLIKKYCHDCKRQGCWISNVRDLRRIPDVKTHELVPAESMHVDQAHRRSGTPGKLRVEELMPS